MKAHIETIDGKVTLKVFYNPATCDWNDAIATGLASYGLKEGKVKVIAVPLPANAQKVSLNAKTSLPGAATPFNSAVLHGDCR